MKAMRLLLPLGCLLASSLFIACSNETEETTRPIEISAKGEYNDVLTYTLTTDTLDCDFDITSSMGRCTAVVLDADPKNPSAVVVQNGNHVTVKLLREHTSIRLSDESGQERRIDIRSTSEKLKQAGYVVDFAYGTTMKLKPSFGTGKYRVVRNSDVADITINAEDVLHIKGNRGGATGYYTLEDQRGIKAFLEVRVRDGRDITSSRLDVTAARGQMLSFPIKLATGDWRIEEQSLRCGAFILDKQSIGIDYPLEHEVLCMNIPTDAKLGLESFHLKDRSGQTVTVNVTITE